MTNSPLIIKSLDTFCPVCTSPMRQIGCGYLSCKTCGYMNACNLPGAGAEVVSIDTAREKNSHRLKQFWM